MGLDDEVFVTRCLQGDQAAFTCLVSEYKEMVYAYAYHKLGDYQQAEDITQEVFIKAYRNLAQLKWPHKFRSWLYTIASNECKLWLREHSREREREVSWEDVPAENLNELAMRNHSDEDINLTVKSAMETLPDDRQLALTLFYMSGLSVREIAYFMGISSSNVRVKLHRARKQLGERVEKMIGKRLRKEKLKSGFVFRFVDSIKEPKPGSIRWAPIPISIGLALLIGIIGYGGSSSKDFSPDIPALKPAEGTFAVSLLPNNDVKAISDMEGLDMGSEDIYQSELASADAGTTTQTQADSGKASSGMTIRRVWETGRDIYTVSPNGRYLSYINWDTGGNVAIHDFETGEDRDITDEANWDKDYQYADMGCMYTWSPDSKQIAYLWFEAPEWSASLRIVGIDGSKPRVLRSSPALNPRAWFRIASTSWRSTGKRRAKHTTSYWSRWQTVPYAF